MRIAFTIILNGLHHLQHNNYAKFLLSNFNYWVVVEGASENKGSTGWCKAMPSDYHNNGSSVDGTKEYLFELGKSHQNLIIVHRKGMWESKDQQVNHAANVINSLTNEAIVWEIDADEQWTSENIIYAENTLLRNDIKTGCFHCDYYVGNGLLAKGEWGEGLAVPYRRLWHWKKDTFASHEPPSLTNGDGKIALLPQRFKHYAYYFEQDVKFKDVWYSRHEGVYNRWKTLQTETVFPQPIDRLVNLGWGYDTTIVKE